VRGVGRRMEPHVEEEDISVLGRSRCGIDGSEEYSLVLGLHWIGTMLRTFS
jgi:hypothetical protein